MNKLEITIIIIVFVYVICMISMLCGYFIYTQIESMDNINAPDIAIKWANDSTCKYRMIKIYEDVLTHYKIPRSTNSDWVLYFPCSYDDMEDEINKVKITNRSQRVFIINNYNEISSKSHMWENFANTYGREKAQEMTPLTYILYDPNDLKLLEKEYDPSKIYIMKKNIQRQEGLKITNDLDTMLKGFENQYVVAQLLLQDPYLIHDRKINMRFYTLIVCQNNNISAYIHNDGFMYYTRVPFEPNTMDDGHNITTGYIERWVYHINPLTHFDFRTYLDNTTNRQLNNAEHTILNTGNKISTVVFDRIYDLIKRAILSVNTTMCVGSKLSDAISFQLFGVDIAIDKNLYPKIMEINIGPNLNTHDSRDYAVKFKVVSDIFKTLKIISTSSFDTNGFIQII